MNRIDNIINEEINRYLMTEGMLDGIKDILQGYLKNKKKSSSEKTQDEKRNERKKKKEREKEKKGAKKLRRTVNGGKEYYDYHDYERKNRKVSKGDAASIRNTVDQNNTDIAAVARQVFPSHTEEGAQSQLRKILNGERPMTKSVASKLEKLISGGKIAVK